MRPTRLLVPLLLLALGTATGRADWQRDDTTLAWRRGETPVWKFCFDPAEGKPHFSSLTAGAGTELAVVHPSDHYWHYGLWFSWKFINGVNYWEEPAPDHHAEGRTRWAAPKIETTPDGAATIRLSLTYARADGRVDLTEERILEIKAPLADGTYMIEWTGHFVAGVAGAVLDRTPLLGEPDGKVYGGYAGLGFRLPPAPLAMTVLTPEGALDHFESDRARPIAPAVACNFKSAAEDLGSVAVINIATKTTPDPFIQWYVVNGEQMRFACASILAPKPITLAPGAALDLHYRIIVQPSAWTPHGLRAEVEGNWE